MAPKFSPKDLKDAAEALKRFRADLSGHSDVGIGVSGTSNSGTGVWGDSTSGSGVLGTSDTAEGVYGASTSGVGIWGESQHQEGVHGISHDITAGVGGYNDNRPQGGPGVYGESQNFDGVFGKSHHPDRAGVSGHNTAGGWSGWFEGNVFVGDTLTVIDDITLTGGDCAEEFDVSGAMDVEPGTVMVLNQEGTLQPSHQAYDKKVAGVISGAGDYKPGLVLDRQQSSENRMPVALVGKVYCKVDAQYAPIEIGDLLTTSPTSGHAMKADDPFQAFGSVIGKALRPWREGQGMIPILIALQ